MTETSVDLTAIQEVIARLRTEVAKAFIGQREVIDELVIALLAGGHVMLEGVPGLGKTLLAKSLSKAVSGKFSRIQFYARPDAKRREWAFCI